MTLKPDHSYFIEYKPTSWDIDLIPRITKGIEQAKADGFDNVFILESDDYYPANYFEKFKGIMGDFDFFGDDRTKYYSLKHRGYLLMTHPYRASLFTTGFKISALNHFDWPAVTDTQLDIKLWKYAKYKRKFFTNTGAIGMKHGIGLCGGGIHNNNFRDKDYQLEWLKKHVDSEAYIFYSMMSDKLFSSSMAIAR